MRRFITRFLSIKNKLIISFIALIVIPVSILGFYITNYAAQVIQSTVLKSSIQSNEQIIKNIDSFLETMLKLSEYPISDQEIFSIMIKDYDFVEFPEYEKHQDFNKMREFLFNKIQSFSSMIDSVILYEPYTNRVLGRTPTDHINANYVATALNQEPWIQEIMTKEGEGVVTSIHRDYVMTSKDEYVIAVGRVINDTKSQQPIGLIAINIRVNNLERLWMDMNLTPNSRFYLIDKNDNIIFGKDENEWSRPISEVLGEKVDLSNRNQTINDMHGEEIYLVSSRSQVSGWRTITIIPKNELFSFIDVMFRIILINTMISILLAIAFSILIATGITKPLYELNKKMGEVGAGNLDVQIDSGKGEIGEISKTVRFMLQEIKRLISKIYEEEEEKRNAEMLALQSQINPHFIYNTLSVIKWMAHMQGAQGIENTVGSFSSLLTYTAKRTENFVSVKEEIDFIKDYLKILNIRYYNKFQVKYDIDKELFEYKLLKFLLQPIIENAIFHGLEGKRKGILVIKGYVENEKIVFSIKDNGKGMNKDEIKQIFDDDQTTKRNRNALNSIGINNIQQRIKLNFGENYGINIDSDVNKGTEVTIFVPAIRNLTQKEELS